MLKDQNHLHQPVFSILRKDPAVLNQDFTVQQALDAIRLQGLGEKIVYFYVVNGENQLVGVLPTRRLLMAFPNERLAEVMIKKVVVLPHQATVFDACEFFVLHKFLAFPVVDENRRIVGVVDVSMFTNEIFDITERERTDELFEAIGFRISQVRNASALKMFRLRFPWLLATIGGGIFCAFLAGIFEITLAKSLLLTFFLTLVLALGESVAMQSMTVTIQALRMMKPSLAWYYKALAREGGQAFLLGSANGTLVGFIIWAWYQHLIAALSIGTSILLSLCAACFFGLSIPAVLHTLKLDPKIAAGPVTLAFTDVFTILFYFTIAAFLL